MNLNASRSEIGYAIGSECNFGSDCENGFQNDLNGENQNDWKNDYLSTFYVYRSIPKPSGLFTNKTE